MSCKEHALPSDERHIPLSSHQLATGHPVSEWDLGAQEELSVPERVGPNGNANSKAEEGGKGQQRVRASHVQNIIGTSCQKHRAGCCKISITLTDQPATLSNSKRLENHPGKFLCSRPESSKLPATTPSPPPSLNHPKTTSAFKRTTH